ncbi:aldehyde dehydrogenase (NADP(+)) [Mumia sp. DW29H23]|uniref:aldehyde dehydrogenase (NADP(+)) n=1 Tax=Mumia sp. DW29H23 TaxID=3421241 RepID=UPI003D691D66
MTGAPVGNPDPAVDRALAAAESARRPARRASAGERAHWLRAVADRLDASSDPLVALAQEESHLPEARLRGELARTTFQLRLFAERLDDGTLLDDRVDVADPEWGMGPRPDLRRAHVPIGPVLVFAASNFPFAFSVAGGDTASALAVGCPVVVKAHPGHPRLSRATATVVVEALAAAGAPDGLFGTIEGTEAGVLAVQDPRVKAVGFTGSLEGGRALYDLASRRPDPIPFYGELGSTNPVVVTRDGWETRADDVVEGFTASFTLGSGQFCTQPGVVLVPDAVGFAARLEIPAVGPMLTTRIADGFAASLDAVAGRDGVEVAARGTDGAGVPAATVLRTTAERVLADPTIVTTEVFGPASVLVEYASLDDVRDVLGLFGGVLTATVQGGETPDADALEVLDQLSEHAGRVIWNQWPTGVVVSDAQQHGGPWPATTAPTTTSVGTAAAARFARPVAFQNVPPAGLPEAVRDGGRR